MAVAAEQLEQIVGTVKTIFLSSMAAVFTVSSAFPPPQAMSTSASGRQGVHDLGDIGTRTVGTVDARLQDLDIGTFKCRLDSRSAAARARLPPMMATFFAPYSASAVGSLVKQSSPTV